MKTSDKILLIAASSDWRLQIDQVDSDWSTLYWDADRFWFTHDVHDGTRPPVYNFIVMARLDEPAVKAHYGPPSRTLDCGGTKVWVYDDVAAFGRALVEGSPKLYATFFEASRGIDHICVPADRFVHRSRPDAATPLVGPLEVRVDTPDERRPQIWGPFFELPDGRWLVTLAYRLTSDAPGRDRWDITLGWDREKTFEGTLPASAGEVRTVETEIALARPERGIEIRSFLAATGRVEIIGARIARAGATQEPHCRWEALSTGVGG